MLRISFLRGVAEAGTNRNESNPHTLPRASGWGSRSAVLGAAWRTRRLGGEGDEAGLVHEMCGVLPFDVTMTARMAMGYCRAALLPDGSAS